MENRRHPRVRCDLESNFKSLGPQAQASLNFTTLQDVSEGGLRFRMNSFLPVHQKVYFHVHVPKAPTIESLAELAWVRELPSLHCYEAGARFVEFPSHHKNTLKSFIFSHLTLKWPLRTP